MDYETLDWMDAFDDSVFTDTIEANDTSALTGFENTETETEASSPLETNETETNETEANNNATQPSDDFFTNFTPTINFSMARAAGPSSMHNDAHSKGSDPASGSTPSSKDDDDDIDIDKYYGGGETSGDDPNDQGGYGSNWDDDDDDDDDDIDKYYGGGKTDGDDDDDDDYGTWTDQDRAEFAKEVAEKAGEEAAATAAAAELAIKNAAINHEDYVEKIRKSTEIENKINNAIAGLNSGEGVGTEESAKAHKAMAEAADKYGENSDEYKKAVAEAIDIDKKELERLQGLNNKIDKDIEQTRDALNKSLKEVKDAKTKAQEAFEKAQAAKENAGTLAGEAAEAFERAQEKQKEWEQKQAEIAEAEKAKAAELAGKSDGGDGGTSNSNSAINNTTTFDLSKTLAKAGAKMTEKEYGQVADFVAKYPGLASFIDGGLTNVEKSAIGNVIAGIQAINAGNYLTAVKEFAQAFGMTLVATFQLLATKAYGLGPRILGIIKSFMENENINYDSQDEDFKTFKEMRDGYDGDSSELMALYKTSKGTTDQKQTFDYMKDNAATNVDEYNEGLVEDVNKVVSDASRKVIHYSPYVLEAVKKWRC